ncbi:hypothetical protein [Melittangium boletus]|uniref:hypothetical protein n=1 Tax=Melittangium boletus TaxID=83453 RepID=UPI0012FE9E0C|nr:hypothetical protein [Melittangium boletus]
MKKLSLGLAVMLASCVRSPTPPPLPVEDDPSIVFPHFFDRPAVDVGTSGEMFALDGVVLRAIRVAADDFLPPGREKRACWHSQEAHRYQVIRQGRVIFVRIDEDLESCGLQYVSLDTGVTYAISEEGRILRRVFDAQAEALPPSALITDERGALPEDAGTPLAVDAGDEDGGASQPAVPDTSTDGGPSESAEPLDGGART